MRPPAPERRCVACRKVRPAQELLRLSAAGGQAQPGKAPGRGCWICREERCGKAALKTGQISRALKGKAADPPLDQLLRWMGLGRLTATEGAD